MITLTHTATPTIELVWIPFIIFDDLLSDVNFHASYRHEIVTRTYV